MWKILELRCLPMLIQLIKFFAVNTYIHLIFFIVFLSILAWARLNSLRPSFCLFLNLLLIKLFFKLIHLWWFSQKCKFAWPIFTVFQSFAWIWLSSSLYCQKVSILGNIWFIIRISIIERSWDTCTLLFTYIISYLSHIIYFFFLYLMVLLNSI